MQMTILHTLMRWMGLLVPNYNASILGTAFEIATRPTPWSRLRVPPPPPPPRRPPPPPPPPPPHGLTAAFSGTMGVSSSVSPPVDFFSSSGAIRTRLP